MSQDELDALAAQHGGISGQSQSGPSQEPDPDTNGATNRAIPKANRQQKIVFKDGWHLTLQPDTNDDGSLAGTYQVVEPLAKDASLTPSTSTSSGQLSAPPNEQYILVRDPQTGQITAQKNPNYVAPTEADKARTTVTASQGVYERQDDGTYKLVIPADQGTKIIGGTSSTDKQLILQDAHGNTAYLANPNYVPPKGTPISSADTTNQKIVVQNADGTLSEQPNPNYVQPKPTTIATNTTDRKIVQQNADGTVSEIDNPNYVPQKPTAVSTNTDAQYLTFIDANGNLTQQPNPNYVQPKPDVLNPNDTAPFIPVLKKDANGNWTIDYQANQNQQTVSSAVLGLYDGLKGQIGDQPGQIPLATAKDLTTMAYQAMQAHTQQQTADTERQRANTETANDALTQATTGGRLGADILNNRATAARDTLNQTLGTVTGSKNFGLGSQVGAGFGSQLLGGINDWTAQLYGGQDTLKTAQDLVHAANPTLAGTPAGAGYTALLSQMLDTKKSQDAASATSFTPGTGSQPTASAPSAPAPASPDAQNAATQASNAVGSGNDSSNTGVQLTPSGQVVFNLHFHPPTGSAAPGSRGALDDLNTGVTL